MAPGSARVNVRSLCVIEPRQEGVVIPFIDRLTPGFRKRLVGLKLVFGDRQDPAGLLISRRETEREFLEQGHGRAVAVVDVDCGGVEAHRKAHLLRVLLEFNPVLLYQENAVGRTPAEVAQDRFLSTGLSSREFTNLNYHDQFVREDGKWKFKRRQLGETAPPPAGEAR